MIKPVVRLCLPVLVIVLGLFVAVPVDRALAHANYVSSTPAADARLSSAPRTVSVVLSEELTGDSTITVVDATGATVDQGDGKIDTGDAERKTLVVSLKSGLGDGVYTVQWSAASVDGHTEPGSFSFTVGTPATTLPATGAGDQGLLPMLIVLALVVLGSGILLRRQGA